jgi:hypothetical protein
MVAEGVLIFVNENPVASCYGVKFVSFLEYATQTVVCEQYAKHTCRIGQKPRDGNPFP